MRRKRDRNFGIRWLRDLLCGVLIGAGAILPGVSGGVLAVVFDIYRPFMEVLTHPRAAIPKYWRWFLPIGLGCAIGFLGFAKGIAAAIDVSSTVTTWLFIGLIVGTVPSLFREAGKEGRSIGSWVSMAVCAGAIFFSLFYVGKVICVTVEPNFWWYNFCGALWGMSLVIPGLTSSSVMMALGLYQPMLEGLARLDFLVLSACLPGMVLTILLLARLVSWFFRKHYSIAFHGIFGIVLASTLVIIPTSYVGAWEIVLSAVCCIGGFLLAYFMARLDRRIQENGRA
uniref:undecaprenyl phosphate translocase family protein n=1 Tax=Dysosmobacter welbionis TaxID=2093857 RepID=UPI00307EC74B